MAVRGPLKRHISKSASDLSERGRLAEELEEAKSGQSHSSGPANSAQSVPQLSVAQKTQSFFNTLRIRWTRNRSRDRKSKRKFREDGWTQKESASTDYAADNSSDHSSSATQSPQHRLLAVQHGIVDPSPLAKPPETAEAQKLQSRPSAPATAILPSLPVYPPVLPTTSEENKTREALLCQHSFFQLRVHLKRGVDLIARDKGGTSDPYVKFKVGGRLLYKSKTIYRDLNPVWDETFTIPIEDAFVPVHIKVFDYDWGLQDDFMGSAYLDLTKLDLGKPTEISLELLDPGKTEYLGEIFLTVTLMPKTQEDKDLGDFGTFRKVKKKILKLRVKGKDDLDEAEDLPEDCDKEAHRKKLKQKLIALRERLEEEIYEDGEVAKAKLKQKISRITEKLLKVDKDDEPFDDVGHSDKRPSGLGVLSKFGRSRTEEALSEDEESEEENDVGKSASAKIMHKICRLSDRLRKEEFRLSKTDVNGSETPNESACEKEEKEAESAPVDEREPASDTERRTSRRLRRTLGKARAMYEALRREDGGDADSLNSEEEVRGRKAPAKGAESSDTDRCESGSQWRSETTELSGSEMKILEKLGQRFRERSDKVQRYFQRSGRIGEVNRRLKSQIWSSVVTIVLVEGKNLQPMDIDGSSDPYVKFRLGNEKYKSKVVYKNLSPSWLEQFDLHLYDDQNQELEVTVWDKDKSKDDFMGRCSIDLSLLEREKTHGLWQDLEEGGGSIHLLLTISGTTASETISDLTTYEDNVRERRNIESRYALRNSFHNLRDVGHLTVKVYRATGLAAADLGGKSDPFCVLELVNARLQTQTEYKTLSPSWQKIFTFNVKDINSVLEVTVYDEDRDHKVEFLGKVAIPLLRIRNGEKRWYCLKDKKLHSRAKGNCPMILLEMHVVWNPVRACIRTLNPKEEKYMQGELKFKRQVFVRNVLRLKAIIMIIIEWGKLIQDCFEWERPAHSAVALVLFVALCYYFEPYMIPTGLLLIFLKYYVVLWLTGGKSSADDEEEMFGEDEEDDEEKDKEEKKSLKERLQAIQEVTQTVQNAIGYIASLGEQIKNTFNFTVPFVSYLAIGLTLAAMVVMYVIPVRYLILIAGVNKFARKLLRPHTIPNNEILDLLSRVPDDEDLIAYREFRPYTSNEVDRRREQRKKHKTS